MASYGLEYSAYLKVASSDPESAEYQRRYRGPKREIPKPVTKADATVMEKYLDEMTAQGLKPSTAKAVATYLCMIAREYPGFQSMDTAKANQAFGYIRKTMKQNTQRRFIPILKNFLQWLHDEKINTLIDVAKTRKNKTPGLDTETKKASDMLSGDEIRKIIDVAGNERDRALIAFMFEGALRPIEACAATWDDLNFDQYGAKFSTSKKTGKSRYIRLIWSGSLLKAWANKYPGEPKGKNPIFISTKHPGSLKQIEPTTVRGLFYSLIKKAGINKAISPYYLRHSRITSMMNDEIPESVVKMQCWGSLKSNMLATYAHMTNKDIDRILLTKAGIITKGTEKDDELRPRQCSTCGKVFGPTTKFCDECGTALTKEAIQSTQAATTAITAALSPEQKKATLASMSKEELMQMLTEIATGKS